MDIDLLFTDDGEAGLICSENPMTKAVGVLFDPASGLLTLEYSDMDFLEMNIPVDSEFFGWLDHSPLLHLGAVSGGYIAQAYQIPIMFADDPYRGKALGAGTGAQNPLAAFDYFVKDCVSGQPVHREDLSDDSFGCVLGDAVPSSLEFAPHLARRHALEVAPKAAPSGPGPGGPGLGGSSGGGGQRGGGQRGGTGSSKGKK